MYRSVEFQPTTQPELAVLLPKTMIGVATTVHGICKIKWLHLKVLPGTQGRTSLHY